MSNQKVEKSLLYFWAHHYWSELVQYLKSSFDNQFSTETILINPVFLFSDNQVWTRLISTVSNPIEL